MRQVKARHFEGGARENPPVVCFGLIETVKRRFFGKPQNDRKGKIARKKRVNRAKNVERALKKGVRPQYIVVERSFNHYFKNFVKNSCKFE